MIKTIIQSWIHINSTALNNPSQMKITLEMWTTAELATAKFTRLIPHCTSPKKIMFTAKSVPWGNGRLDKVIDKPYNQRIVCLVSGLYVRCLIWLPCLHGKIWHNSGPKTSEGHFWLHYNYIKFIMIENLSSTLMWQKYKRNHAQPRERFELSTPGLQDQCSNHWANEATTNERSHENGIGKYKWHESVSTWIFYFLFFKTTKMLQLTDARR